MREPDDDRDEPTDDEIVDAVARCECDDILVEVMSLETDKEILEWARVFKASIYEAIEINRENSDGDE